MKGPSKKSTPQMPQTVRKEHAGKWVAWTEDAMRIVAAAETPEAVRIAAERAGVRNIVYQWVPPADERFVGTGI